MYLGDISYEDAIAKAANFIALGQTTVYVRDTQNFPWGKATGIDLGSSYRSGIPVSGYVIVEEAGLELKASFEIEGHDANGKTGNQIDAAGLRALIRKLPKPVQVQFADKLAKDVLPKIMETRKEWEGYLSRQLSSEECVRGVIAFAKE